MHKILWKSTQYKLRIAEKWLTLSMNHTVMTLLVPASLRPTSPLLIPRILFKRPAVFLIFHQLYLECNSQLLLHIVFSLHIVNVAFRIGNVYIKFSQVYWLKNVISRNKCILSSQVSKTNKWFQRKQFNGESFTDYPFIT